jgi:hypothetical protein
MSLRKIIKEELNNHSDETMNNRYPERKLLKLDKDILSTFLSDFNGEFDEDKARAFLKYLNIRPYSTTLTFFEELVKLNPDSNVDPSSIILPEYNKYEILFDVVERQWVSSRHKVITYAFTEKEIDERIGDDIDWWNGKEISSVITDSQTESSEIISMGKIDS